MAIFVDCILKVHAKEYMVKICKQKATQHYGLALSIQTNGKLKENQLLNCFLQKKDRKNSIYKELM